jgi:hypothetical protein
MCVFGVAAARAVTISGLTISNGACGIFCDHSTLTVSNCVVTGNSSYGGVSINDVHGPATRVERRNSRRDAQKVDRPFAGNSLTIANSVVSDNAGPGVNNVSAMVTILNSTISGNSTGQDWGYGGGIYSSGTKFPGNLIVNSSTISGNSALYSGGGIACGISFLTITNSTISGNSTGDPDYGDGGGISASSMTIANSTVTGNSAAVCGGVCGGTVDIGNTILSANASGNIDGTVTSHGYNISSDDGGGHLNGPGDQINTDPLLGPLHDNGGPTLTHLPSAGSPAIEAGDPNFTPPPFRDQRGPCFYRVFGRRIDVGSVETQPGPRCPTPRPRPTP